MWRESDDEERRPGRHLAIAGTGRAGTSFLVRYLTDLGMETTLSRHGDTAIWDEKANAGLEENLATSSAGDLPYVVKSPWLFESIDLVLSRPDIILDAVVVPVRDLVEAATSRTVLERQAVHQAAPWMVECDRSWETWGTTAGGLLYSLNPLDEGRLLAVGFHHLLERLTAAEVPVVLLAFSKFARDPKYLYRQLRPWLPSSVTELLAIEVHQKLADTAKVRIGDEIGTTKTQSSFSGTVCAYPQREEVDHIALRREVVSLRQEADDLRRALLQAEAREAANAAAMQAKADDLRRALLQAEAREAANAAAMQAKADDLRRALLQAEAREAANAAAMQAKADDLRRALLQAEAREAANAAAMQAKADDLRARLVAMRRSYSWRLTKPLRAVAALAC